MYADWDGVLICVPFLFTLLSVWLLCPNMKYIASHASHLYPDTREGKNTHCPFFPQFSQFGGFASFFFCRFFFGDFHPVCFFSFFVPIGPEKNIIILQELQPTFKKLCHTHILTFVNLSCSENLLQPRIFYSRKNCAFEF